MFLYFHCFKCKFCIILCSIICLLSLLHTKTFYYWSLPSEHSESVVILFHPFPPNCLSCIPCVFFHIFSPGGKNFLQCWCFQCLLFFYSISKWCQSSCRHENFKWLTFGLHNIFHINTKENILVKLFELLFFLSLCFKYSIFIFPILSPRSPLTSIYKRS